MPVRKHLPAPPGTAVADDWEVTYDAVHFLARKWVIAVLAELAHGPRRHNELARAIGADHRPLDRVLAQLQGAGFIEREVDVARKPVRVHYRLTPRAVAMRRPLEELTQWWQRPSGQ